MPSARALPSQTISYFGGGGADANGSQRCANAVVEMPLATAPAARATRQSRRVMGAADEAAAGEFMRNSGASAAVTLGLMPSSRSEVDGKRLLVLAACVGLSIAAWELPFLTPLKLLAVAGHETGHA